MPKYLAGIAGRILDLAEDQKPRPGRHSGHSLQRHQGPGSDTDHCWIINEAKCVEALLGTTDGPGFTVTSAHEDVAKVQRSELEVIAAFMRRK